MPVLPFQGSTFVAFMDIAGFKSMMIDSKRAQSALDAFYSTGFRVLREHRNNGVGPLVDGFFVSDCGVLFVRGEEGPPVPRLESLCRVVQQMHRRSFEHAIQLTTSISWGPFSYQDRIEFPGIEKNPIYGSAYVAAFIDNERGTPKLYPSECRLMKLELPPEVSEFCTHRVGRVAQQMREDPHHFYYEWMRQHHADLQPDEQA